MTLVNSETSERGEVVGVAQNAAREAQTSVTLRVGRAILFGLARAGMSVGLGVMGVGFLLISLCWYDVAGQKTVAGQLPYLMSAGLPGAMLVAVGLATVDTAARVRAYQEVIREVRGLAATLSDLDRGGQKDELPDA